MVRKGPNSRLEDAQKKKHKHSVDATDPTAPLYSTDNVDISCNHMPFHSAACCASTALMHSCTHMRCGGASPVLPLHPGAVAVRPLPCENHVLFPHFWTFSIVLTREGGLGLRVTMFSVCFCTLQRVCVTTKTRHANCSSF